MHMDELCPCDVHLVMCESNPFLEISIILWFDLCDVQT
jgi:hypothetical protein